MGQGTMSLSSDDTASRHARVYVGLAGLGSLVALNVAALLSHWL